MNSTLAGSVERPARAGGADWITALAFRPRKESWVAASPEGFHKLFRASDDPVRDWLDPACTATAAREYADMQLLHRAAADVCLPVRRDHACIVYPYLSGPDLRATLRTRGGGGVEGAAGLAAAMRVLAHVHTTREDLSCYAAKAYPASSYLPPDLDVLRRIAARPRRLCLEGFEVRNFRYDRRRDAWCFFDPQAISLGVAENDVARFIVSLLMVNWGHGGGLRIWTAFDANALLAAYERAAGDTLDATLLAYFTHESIAMRRHFAERALGGLRGTARLLGRPYLANYFRQLDHWAHQHEF
ncbi:MAG TPA: hypothetical protein VFQ95_06705 [Rhodanobacteraceae bacterium]|nr:hypothetical protein [Rhodanobacteraceae bacterium]